MKKGTKFKIKKNTETEALEVAGKTGVVIGPDPRRLSRDIVAVKLDDGSGALERDGIAVAYLTTATAKK